MKRTSALLLALAALFSCAAGFLYIPWLNALAAGEDDEPAVYSEAEAETFALLSDEAAEAAALAGNIDVDAPCAILIEKSTGAVIFEKNADERRAPASVTKIMTLLLTVEALERGELSLDEKICVSDEAAEKGGSQIFLEPGEEMSVHELIKSVAVSSANDAAAALACRLAGSEAAFVEKMNSRAEALGMSKTVFSNCTGLPVEGEHLTTARDISVMSRELLKHDIIKEYSTIWMDTVRDGSFGLANTNKMIYYYPGATGLKTGYTAEALYCLSASAERDGVEYIAVVMGCESSEKRFAAAKALLDYAFANYCLLPVAPDFPIPSVPVALGASGQTVPVIVGPDNVLVTRSAAADASISLELPSSIAAPLKSGDRIGTLRIRSGGEVIAELPLAVNEDIPRLSWTGIFREFMRMLLRGEM